MNLNNPPLREEWGSPGWSSWFTQVMSVLIYGQHWGVKTVAANYTCQKHDSVILLNGDITVTLPAVSVGGSKRITVKVINAGAGTRTVDGGDANIDGSATVTTTTQYTSWDFVTDGTNWFIV